MDEAGKQKYEEMLSKRGFVFPSFELLCDMDPELIERYENLKDYIMGKESAMPEKLRELFISIAIAVRNPSAHNQIKLHLQRATKLGATHQECLEAFESILAPCGMMILIAGCEALKEVIDEEKNS